MASCLKQSRKVLWKCCSFPPHYAHHDFEYKPDTEEKTMDMNGFIQKGKQHSPASAWNRRDALLSWPTQFLTHWLAGKMPWCLDAFKELTSGRFNKFKQATLQIIVSQHLWRVSLQAHRLRTCFFRTRPAIQPVQQSSSCVEVGSRNCEALDRRLHVVGLPTPSFILYWKSPFATSMTSARTFCHWLVAGVIALRLNQQAR